MPLIEPARSIKRYGNTVLAIGNSIGEGGYGLATQTGVSWCGLPGGTANLGDIAHPSYRDRRLDHQIHLRCVRAGAVGATEPYWPAVGEQIDDGAARWVVERTSGMNQNPGFWNLAMEMLGQPLDLIYSVGGPGRVSEFVIDHARRALQHCDPDIVFVSDLYANNVSQANGDMPSYRASWADTAEFLDEQVAAGRFVILQGVTPGNMFNTPDLRAGCGYFHNELASWTRANAGVSVFWGAPAEELGSLVYGQNWNPDDVTVYQIATGEFNKVTDGVHPMNAAQWRLATSLAKLLSETEIPQPRHLQDAGVSQKWDNPRNLGTSGTINTGIVGQAPTGWDVGRDGVATAVSALERRDDGVSGYWWSLAAQSANGGKVYAYRSVTLAASGFAIGDEIEVLAEMVGADMSATAFCPKVEVAFWNATEYQAFSSMNFTGGQQFGQAMGSDNVVQLVKPIPFALKVPTGTTNIAITVSIEGSGAWSGTLTLGRINLNNLSA